MGIVQVEPEGLSAAATRCDGWAGELTATSVPTVAGSPDQATAAAVSAADAAAAAAGAAMVARMQATAAKLVAGSNSYVSTDSASGAHLSAVADAAVEI